MPEGTPIALSPQDIRSQALPPERARPTQDQIKDEFSNKDDVLLLKPLDSFGNRLAKIKEPYGERREAWENGIKESLIGQFEYLSRTRDLEIATPRTEILQNIVNRMLKGTSGGEDPDVRVVIMRREGTANAFVFPDGTVFISQQLLNQLDTLDEVASVLAHEVGHLKYETGFKKSQVDKVNQFGVEWLHEAACDQKAKSLLENGGFNSLAFSSAIEKIAGFESRGTAHQSGLSRASQSVGSHFFLDSKTSHIEQIKIEGEYAILHEPSQRTNLDITQELIKTKSGEELKVVLESLHPADFSKVYNTLFHNRKTDYEKVKTANNIIISRMQTLGYSPAEAALFVISLQGSDWQALPEDSYLLDTPEAFSQAIGNLEKIENVKAWQDIYKKMFETPATTSSVTLRILKLLGSNLYNKDLEPDGKGIPVDQGSLLNGLERIQKIELATKNDSRTHDTGIVLIKFIETSFIKKDYGKYPPTMVTDIEGVKVFLQEVKDRGITFDPKDFKKEYGHRYITKEVLDTLQEVFNISLEEEEYNPLKKIDHFFESLIAKPGQENSLLFEFLHDFRTNLDRKGLDDAKRKEFIEYIESKLDTLNLRSRVDLQGSLKLPYEQIQYLYPGPDEKTADQNARLIKFNQMLIMTLGIYKSDGNEFYQTLEKSFNQLNIDYGSLSREELINLCQPLFAAQRGEEILSYMQDGPHWMQRTTSDYRSLSFTQTKDYNRLIRLSAIQAIMEKGQQFDFQNFKELDAGIKDMLGALHFRPFSKKQDIKGFPLFDDNLLNLVIGKDFAENARNLLGKGISEQEYADLYQFISSYYPDGTKKRQFLTEINKKYLNSAEVSIEDKTNYLITFFESVGPEGMVIVADQIEDIATYRKFRARLDVKFQEYLKGAGIVTKIAAADYLTSHITKDFKRLIDTCRDEASDQEKISTEMARYWFDLTFGSGEGSVSYDEKSGKFIVGTGTREAFKSLGDIFSSMKDFSHLQRFAMAHKALTDVGGALTNPENRRILADVLVGSLRLGKGFIRSAVSAAALEADPKFISFPASNLLSSLLFRAFDINKIDIDHVRLLQTGRGLNSQALGSILSEEDVLRILSSDTRTISVFGSQYGNNPDSSAAKLALESDQIYFDVTTNLEETLGINTTSSLAVERESKTGEIDPTIEAVIKAVEATGALGIRSLQLATQFQRFPPEVERRLSESFDSNPGLNKLLFWENLNKLAEENPEIDDFVNRIRLGKYLGGGSLQTTYAASITMEDGSERAVIMKMKNPNVEAFIKQAYTITHGVLETAGKDKSVKGASSFAKIGMLVTDLAQNWCLADINDKTFEVDDDQFRQTVAGFNQYIGRDQFYAPERLFTSPKVKSEDLAKGDTVNRVLNDPNVDAQTKRTIVESMGRFFIYQLKAGDFSTDLQGRQVRLVHSDPHVGNYIVDPNDPEFRIGVIDRSLYLKMEKEDINVLDKLVTSTNSTDFVWSFVNRVMDLNKVRGIERVKVQARVIAKVGKEFARQYVQGNVNKTLLLKSMLGELSSEGMDVPLNLRLMIRNIGAFQELSRKYGINFEALYKEIS